MPRALWPSEHQIIGPCGVLGITMGIELTTCRFGSCRSTTKRRAPWSGQSLTRSGWKWGLPTHQCLAPEVWSPPVQTVLTRERLAQAAARR